MRRSHPSTEVSGPLAPFEEGFVAQLMALGYVTTGLSGQRALFAHLDRWLGATGRSVADLRPEVLEQFLQARAAEGYVGKLTKHGLEPLVDHLDHLGLYTRPVPSPTAADRVVALFHQHLLNERGLGDDTAHNYQRVARQFLDSLPDPLEPSLSELTAAEVTAFILDRSAAVSVATMQTVVGGMRALLVFVYAAGLAERSLASAVPTVARRREDLPRGLSAEHVEALLAGCDRTTPVGIRDFAVLTVLARLGLRANEVATLRLDDIDWAAAEIRIRGKGPRQDRLPLPADVGQALVAYLQRARPDCADRRVFIRSCAPRQGLSRQAVGGLVRAASVRAGLSPHGPHRLRHTVATELLRKGAPLTEIAQLMRHQSFGVTVIYAKVDLAALVSLAQPWPGETQ
jgi:integrase/recombinase XerD